MPLAVVMEEPERFDLKTCPGGYVAVQRMSYGQKVERRGFNAKMEMEIQRGSRNAKSIVEVFNAKAEMYDLTRCIVDHNLTKLVDEAGNPCKRESPGAREVLIDFTKPSDINLVSGKIIEEICTILDKVNNFEEDEELGNSSGESVHS